MQITNHCEIFLNSVKLVVLALYPNHLQKYQKLPK